MRGRNELVDALEELRAASALIGNLNLSPKIPVAVRNERLDEIGQHLDRASGRLEQVRKMRALEAL